MKAERIKGQKLISSQGLSSFQAMSVRNRKDAICYSSVSNPGIYLDPILVPLALVDASN